MIKAVDIVVGYQGTTGTPVAGPLSFSFADGECVMLRGRNGSGKTTLMKTLAGLLPPLSGSFETGGEALRQAQGRSPPSCPGRCNPGADTYP